MLFDLDKLLQKLAHCTARTTNLLKKFQFEESVTILKCNLSPSHLEINTTRIETHKAAANERCSSIVEAVFCVSELEKAADRALTKWDTQFLLYKIPNG